MPSKTPPKPQRWLNAAVYDAFLWVFTIVVDLFFREIHPRTSYRIPRTGPVIFVAAPHANQFVDPLILMRTVRHNARRRIAFLIAEKSLRRRFVGFAARLVDSVSVGRALDSKKPAAGKIRVEDWEGDPCLVKGVGTDFENKAFMESGLLVLPSVNNTAANAEIKEILGKEELRLKKPFKGDVAYKQLTGKEPKESGDENGHAVGEDVEVEKNAQGKFEGTSFLVAPHVDQSAVYDSVFRRLREGGCIGIFPEGGSHDRTELLPFKAGVAIMALGALAEDPDCGVKIMPVGMNYFHAHKFRSRCVIEFGKPIEVPMELVEMYKSGNRREATAELLETVYMGLRTVTTLAPDYDTLMLIQAVRRLYNPKGKKLPLSMVVELNRRLMKGYETYKDDPRIVSLRKEVLDYNKQLFHLHIRDHQVGYAKYPWLKSFFLLLWRITQLAFLSVAVLPGVLLFAPVFIAGKAISIRKSREALAESSVKIRARDVIATWKILVSLFLTPLIDVIYSSLTLWWTWYNRVGGRVPPGIPLWLVYCSSLLFFPAVCFMALRFGEIGMDIFKSLRPLVLALLPSSGNTMVRLRTKREDLSARISDIVNELGPELFPDFDSQRIIDDPFHPLHSPDRSRPGSPRLHRRTGSDFFASGRPSSPEPTAGLIDSAGLPRNDSFKDIGSIGLFATRPDTPNRSRSRTNSNSSSSGGGGAAGNFQRRKQNAGLGFTAIDTVGGDTVTLSSATKQQGGSTKKSDLDEVSRNLHAAMRERGRRRKSGGEKADAEDDNDAQEGEEGWEFEDGREELEEKKKKVV